MLLVSFKGFRARSSSIYRGYPSVVKVAAVENFFERPLDVANNALIE